MTTAESTFESQKILLEKVLSLFPENSPIIYRDDMTGQSYENEKIVIGARASIFQDVSFLTHEMCHFTELELDRLLSLNCGGWGLSPGKYWQIGTSWGFEAFSDQGVQREKRVWAFQLALETHLGHSQLNLGNAYQLVRSAVHINSWCNYQPFENKVYDDKERLKKLAEETLKLAESEEYCFERWKAEWDSRINALRQKQANFPSGFWKT